MRLRRQLLLVSLLTLALPWAGCEYIREMEKTLRQGQQAALQASARAVAARLASDPATRSLLSAANAPEASTSGDRLYAHSLPARPILDGYSDDWRQLGIAERAFGKPSNPLRWQLWAGRWGEELFLFFRVHDQSLNYHSPLQPLHLSDHLLLWLAPNGKPTGFHVFTGAPGQVSVVQADSQDREHRISGLWQEWEGGYQLELRLPLAWAESRFGVAVHNGGTGETAQVATADAPAAVPPLALRQLPLDRALAVFTGPDSGVLLRLATENGWIAGQAGAHAPPPPVRLEGDALLTRVYRLILGQQAFPALKNPQASGRFTADEVEQALSGNSSARWYQNQGQQVVRVAVPVKLEGASTAAVVAEQTTNTLRAMTDSAFSRLVSYSLAAFAVTGIGLIAYASWLSWRIRRLSKAAEQAVDSQGRISRDFPRSNSADEIGDLSRSYSQLLERLNQYNSYLETLASKLSHELRTPLAVVRSSLDNLEHHTLPAEAGVYHERAREGAERLSHILTAMSAASRVEQSIQAAEVEELDLKELLQELTRAYADAYPQVGWSFSTPEQSLTIEAAPDLLVQMLDKLADNAADFSPPGATVEIGLARRDQVALVQVTNAGPPLPATMQGQLFDSLVSVREERSAGHHLGLGLYIVRLIAEFHQGTVAASNRPDGTGAVFTVSLPTQHPRGLGTTAGPT